jgi:hypothetical protein
MQRLSSLRTSSSWRYSRRGLHALRQLQIGAQERTAQLGNEFLAGVALIAPRAPEIAGQAHRMPGRMDEFMSERGVTGCRSVARLSAFHSKPLGTWIFQTLRPEQGQPFAVQKQAAQREACAQPVVVLLQAPVSHLVKSKHPLQYPQWMLYLRPDSSLHPLLLAL